MEETAGNILMERPKRNYGIDLLRIISMFFVCIIHVLDHGSVLEEASKFTLQYEVAWFINIVALCAVNCYALVSGYVGVDSKYKVSNIVYLWLQVIFYSLGITILFAIFMPETFSINRLITSAFPVTFTQYWYFTAYFGLFLFMPLFNYTLNHLSEKSLRYTLISIVFACTILTIPNTNDLFKLSSGYSTLWLMVLYLVGGYIKKYDPFRKIKSKFCFLTLIVLIILTWLSRLCIELVTSKIFGEAKWGSAFSLYISLPIFMIAVTMLELLSRIPFQKKPHIIAFFAPLSFGVYLIHDNFLIRKNIIRGRFAFYAEKNTVLMLFAVIGTALAIYIVCSLIDYLRLLLFNLLKVKPILQKAEIKIRNKILKEK